MKYIKVNRKIKSLVSLALLTIPMSFCFADIQNGINAYNNGDFEVAISEFRPLAEQGDAIAQFNMAEMYAGGLGVVQDINDSIRWYRMAAAQGHSDSQANLDVIDGLGGGVLKDSDLSFNWFIKAAKKGVDDAKSNSIIIYSDKEININKMPKVRLGVNNNPIKQDEFVIHHDESPFASLETWKH